MLFQDSDEHRHVKQIKEGKKTETRRVSDRWAMTLGKVYPVHPASGGIFQQRDEARGYIQCIDRWEEPLHEMGEENAFAEGGYTLPQFKELWREINGEWNPETVVKAYRFRYIGEQDPGLKPGTLLPKTNE